MIKGNLRAVSFIPVFVIYFGFPLIRDVLPYHHDYAFEDWIALVGMYAIGVLIASPLIYLLIKTSGLNFKASLSIYGGSLLAAIAQGTCMFLFWDDAIPLYITMVIIMGVMSIICAYFSRSSYLILDKDTGNVYRIRGSKAYRVADEELERYRSNVSGKSIPMAMFSSNTLSDFDRHSPVIPFSYASTGSTTFDYNSVATINPSSGMPMVGGISGLDIHGNSWGTNFNEPSSTYDPNRGY